MFQLFGSNSIIDQNTLRSITNGFTYQQSINNDQLNNYQQNELSTIEFARRPDYGKEGKKIRLEVNHFKLILPPIIIYHYKFNIEPSINKNLNRLIYDKMILNYNQLFDNKIVIYDNDDNLYSKTFLPIGFNKIELDIFLGNKNKFDISIQFKDQLNLDLLKDILDRKSNSIPNEIVNCVDSVMRSSVMRNILNQDKYIPIDKSFFDITNSIKNSLSNGKEISFGWIQQCVPTYWQMTMKVDMTASVFYKSQSIINFICETFDFAFLDKRRCLNDYQRQKLLKEIKGLKIEVNYGNCKRKYRIVNILKKPLYLQTFILNQDNGIAKEVYLVNYFKEKYNIDLEYVNLPSIHVGSENRQIYLPPELCEISKGQRCKKLTDLQTSAMIRSTAISASDRKNQIKSIVKQVNFNNDKLVNDFGFMINDEMEQIEGRILKPPLLHYKEQIANPKSGKWNTNRKKFYCGKVINKYAIICFSSHTVKEQAIRNFIQQLTLTATNVGMQITNPPCFCKYADDIKQVEPIFDYIKRTYPTIQLIIFILPGKTTIYSEIKRLGDTQYGIITQCIQSKTVNNCNGQTLSNILMKINVKLNGINLILNPEERTSKFNQPIILFGANVSKLSDPKTFSVVSVVSSMDGYPIKYAARIKAQIGNDEILELSLMVKELLLQFYRETNFIKPHRIVFYRQGIINLKYLRTIFYNELTAIRNSCLQLENGNYRPGITYISVQKRHHTRLFCKDQIDEEGISGNVPAGTTLDNSIVNPTEFDFYLCSHSGVQGTSRPSYYHILHDDNKFSADEIQKLTYQLCHTYARCARSVSLPAPSYYSQLATKQAKVYLLLLDSEILRNKITELQKENSENENPNDIFLGKNATNQETVEAINRLLKLHENTLSTMFFI